MDLLSDVLSLLKPQIHGAGGLDLGEDCSIGFPSYDGIKCYAVVSGQCWLLVEGFTDAVSLSAGDCFLLPQGRPFRLATNLQPGQSDTPDCSVGGGVLTFRGGGSCFIVGGHFFLAKGDAGRLLNALAPIVYVRDEEDKAELRWALKRMREELSDNKPGSSLFTEHLAHMLLIHALRLHLARGSSAGVGWLFALADKQMSAAIQSIHSDPGHPWTLQALAEKAGMSRSGFALRFKELVGETPMGYVTHWRMLLAGERLANSAEPVSVLARSLGYESENAFSTAFKRVMGRSPTHYGRQRGALHRTSEHEPNGRRHGELAQG